MMAIYYSYNLIIYLCVYKFLSFNIQRDTYIHMNKLTTTLVKNATLADKFSSKYSVNKKTYFVIQSNRWNYEKIIN